MPRYIDADAAIRFSRLRYASDLDKEEVSQFIDAAEQTLAADLQITDLKEMEKADGTLPADLVQALLILTGDNYRERESISAAQLYKSPYYWHLIYSHVKYLSE